jgi:hypothetical protein
VHNTSKKAAPKDGLFKFRVLSVLIRS